MKKQFRSFKDARKYVHSLNLKNSKEWSIFSKSKQKPDDIPATPHQVYKYDGWVNLGDWLGIDPSKNKSRKFRSFKDARKFVHTLKISDQKGWREYCKSGNIPIDIPKWPPDSYKKEWTSWGDWLGTGYIAGKFRKYRSFKRARKFVHSLKLKNGAQWKKYCNSGNKPEDIPKRPDSVYKDEWIDSGDWLGTNYVSPRKRKYRPFSDARKFVHSLKLKNSDEWRKYCKSGKKPKDIPNDPRKTYKKDWVSMGNWLGNDFVFARYRKYRPFTDARKFIHSLKLKNQKEWRIYCRSGKKPDDIPANPPQHYEKEWISYGDWLGTGSVDPTTMSKNYPPFEKARNEARKYAKKYNLKTRDQWNDAVKKGIIPKYLPANPWNVYSKRKKK